MKAWGSRQKSTRGWPASRALPLLGVASWAVMAVALVLVSGVTPPGYVVGTAIAAGAACVALSFAAVALVLAAGRARGDERLPWALFCFGVAARLAAEAVWVGARTFGAAPPAVVQVALHSLSCVLLFAVLLWLMSTLRKEMVSVAALDALAVMLTSGLVIYFFALGSGVGLGGEIAVLARLARPVSDIGLLFLGLAALLSVRRPRFVVVMNGGLVVLILADAAYLWGRVQGSYEPGFAEVLWSGGVMTLAFAALIWGGSRVSPAEHLGARGVVLFWFGPMSPLVQYGFLLLWGALRGPLPAYVLAGGVVLAVLLAIRMVEISRALNRQARTQQELARQAEGNRILRELHDTVKQGVHGTSMMLEAAALADGKGDSAAVRDLLDKALQTTRETGRQLSRPLDELKLLSGNAGDAEDFFGRELGSFGERFGMRTRADLQAPLAGLTREQLSAAHRVFVEAAWNAAKHSGAENLVLETRQEGRGFVLRLCDDGRGFDPARVGGGYGMRSMRSRAEEAAAVLDVRSTPGEGTVVELRFGR